MAFLFIYNSSMAWWCNG